MISLWFTKREKSVHFPGYPGLRVTSRVFFCCHHPIPNKNTFQEILITWVPQSTFIFWHLNYTFEWWPWHQKIKRDQKQSQHGCLQMPRCSDWKLGQTLSYSIFHVQVHVCLFSWAACISLVFAKSTLFASGCFPSWLRSLWILTLSSWILSSVSSSSLQLTSGL